MRNFIKTTFRIYKSTCITVSLSLPHCVFINNTYHAESLSRSQLRIYDKYMQCVLLRNPCHDRISICDLFAMLSRDFDLLLRVFKIYCSECLRFTAQSVYLRYTSSAHRSMHRAIISICMLGASKYAHSSYFDMHARRIEVCTDQPFLDISDHKYSACTSILLTSNIC